jgi:hypothetical protein
VIRRGAHLARELALLTATCAAPPVAVIPLRADAGRQKGPES